MAPRIPRSGRSRRGKIAVKIKIKHSEPDDWATLQPKRY